MDARVDICDIYAFQKPGDANTSVLVFNVNPVAPTFADSFAPEAVYELKVDVNEDAVAEIAYRFTFSSKENGMREGVMSRKEYAMDEPFHLLPIIHTEDVAML